MIPIEDQIWFMRTQIDTMQAKFDLDVATGRLLRKAADRELESMRAVLRTLVWCQDSKPLIVELRKAQRRAA